MSNNNSKYGNLGEGDPRYESRKAPVRVKYAVGDDIMSVMVPRDDVASTCFFFDVVLSSAVPGYVRNVLGNRDDNSMELVFGSDDTPCGSIKVMPDGKITFERVVVLSHTFDDVQEALDEVTRYVCDEDSWATK